MFEGILEKFLQQKLGKYLEGIDKQNLSVGVWGGNILLENLLIKANVFDQNGIPLRLKFGKIKKLSMKVPWTRLSSAPVELVLQTLYLVVEPKSSAEWETKETWSYANKQRIIEEFVSMMAANLKMHLLEKSEQKEDGYVDKLVTKIVDNLQLTIQNIHIRYEDPISMPNNYFSFGVTLKELSINTTNSNWNSTFIDRLQSENKDKPLYKRLKIEGLAIYLQVDDPIRLSQVGQIQGPEVHNQNVQLIIQKSEIDRQIEDKLKEMFSKENLMIEGMEYLILPIELEIRMIQLTKIEIDKPILSLDINLNELGLVLHKKQYEAIFKFIDFFQKYSKFSQSVNSAKKYQFIRPVNPILFKPSQELSLYERKLAKLQKQATIKKEESKLTEQIHLAPIVSEPQINELDDDEFFDALEDQNNSDQLGSVKSDGNEEIYQSFILKGEKQQNEMSLINQVNEIRENNSRFKNMNAVEWWRFAINGALKDIRFKRGSWGEFTLSKSRKRQYGRLLISLVQKCLTKEFQLDLTSLSESDKYLYIHIIQANELQDIQYWLGLVIKKRVEKQVKDQKEKESKEGSILSYFMSWGGKAKQNADKQALEESKAKGDLSDEEEEFTLNDDEIEEIKASIKSSLTDLPTQSLNDLNLTEDQKNKMVKIQLYCNFQRGKISLIEKGQVVEIFQENLIVKFKAQRDKSFDAIVMNKNAGLYVQQLGDGLNQGEKKHLVRKLKQNPQEEGMFAQAAEEDNNLWVLKINKDNSAIDDLINIDFESSPIFITYDALGLSKISEFFKADYAEELKSKAYDKLSQMKDQTSLSVQDLLQKKQNNFTIKIASPQIEIPFLAHNSEFVGEPEELRPRTWIVNLGNIFFKNQNSKQEQIDEYERFYLQVNEISLLYLKHGHLAQVLEEVTIELDLAIKNDIKAVILKKNQRKDSQFIGMEQELVQESPEVLVNAKLPALKLNMSPDIFNGLVNINEILKSHGAEEDLLQLRIQKDKILAKAQFKDNVQTRGVRGYNNYWTNYFSMVSGNYIYFYKSKNELMPYHYLNIIDISLDSEISKNDKESFELKDNELPYLIQVMVKGGEKLILNFKEIQIREELKQIIIEMQRALMTEQKNSNALGGISDIVHKDPNQIGVKLGFIVQNIELRIFNLTDYIPSPKHDQMAAQISSWLAAKVENLNLTVVQYAYEIKIQVGLSSLNIRETKALNKDLIRNEAGSNLLSIDIDVYDIYSPNIGDAEIIVRANLGKLVMLFEPNTINEAIKFFRNVKSSRKKNLESLQHQLMSQDDDVNQGEVQHAQTCKQIQFILIKAIIKASGLSILCAHHEYYSPVFEMSLGESTFDYYMFYDHDIIEGRFKECQVFDFTNYPQTIKPWEAPKANLDKRHTYPAREIIGSRAVGDKISNEIYFKTQLYTLDCPLKPKESMSILDLDVSQVKILYILEQAFRIQDYFFDKFLWAVTETDPYLIESENLLKDLQGFSKLDEEAIMDFDLKQKRNETIMNIKIHRPYVILKDRPYLDEMLEIDLGEIIISADEMIEKKRFINAPEKTTFFTNYVIKGKDLGITYKNKEQKEFQVTEAFDLNLDFQKISWSPYLSLINSAELDKSDKIKIEFQPSFQIRMTQEFYTYLLRCVDLNLAYTDNLQNHFAFALQEEYFKSHEFLKKSQITIKTKVIQLTTYEKDSILTQLALQDPQIIIDQYLNKRYNYEILIENICSFFKSEDSKQLLFGKLTQIHRILTDDDPIDFFNVQDEQNAQKQLQVTIQMYPNGAKEFQVQINKLKLFVYPYFYMMLLNFFSEGMPAYKDDSFDKPNEFNSDFEEIPEMKLIVILKETLLCFAPEEQSIERSYKTIACQAFVEYEFKRERIRRVKNEIWKQLKDVNSLDQLEDKNVQLPITWMRVQGKEICPFICDLSDLEICRFDEVNKREIISPFNLSYFYARYLQFRPRDFKLINYEKSEVKLDLIMLKISYFDVQLLMELLNEFNCSLERFTTYQKIYLRQKESKSRLRSIEEHKEYQRNAIRDRDDMQSEELKGEQAEDETDAFKTAKEALSMLTSLGRKQTFKQKKEDQLRQNRLNLLEQSTPKPKQPQDLESSREPENFIEDIEIDYDKIEQKLQRFQSAGIQVVVINDHNNTFYPVLSLNVHSFLYKMQHEFDKQVGETQLKGMVSYFNSEVGEWEPLIEKAKIQYLSDSYKDQNFILLSFRNDLNINITSQLMQIMIKTQLQLQEKDKTETSNQLQNVIQNNRASFNYAINNSLIGSNSSYLSRKKEEFKDAANNEQASSKQLNEYKVTPYTIVNHCSKPIRVQRVFTQDLNKRRKAKIPKYYDLLPGETADYEVDYEEEANQLMKISRDELVRKTDFINVIFNNGESIMKNINLRDINVYHHEFNETSSEHNNYVGFGVILDQSNMKKVFMLRSPYVMNNVTDLEYNLQIVKDVVKVDDKGQNVLFYEIIRNIILKPQQCYPISFEDMNYRFQISSQSSPNEWSNPIHFRTIIDKVPKNKTTYLYHGKQYSVITKIKSQFKKCYNINLKTPVVIKNALPCNLRIRCGIILKQNVRVFQRNGKREYQYGYDYEMKEFYVPKGQCLQLYNYNLNDDIKFSFTLDNDQVSQSQESIIKNTCFQWQDVAIQNHELTSEKCFVLYDSQNKQSTLDLPAKLSTTKSAGVQVTFYAKNVIINNTDQNLSICYNQNLPVAGQMQAQDNSVVLVSNVKLTFYNKLLQREKVIARIQLPDGKWQFSDPFNIEVAGVTSQISLRKSKFSFYDFKVKTQLSLACSDEEIYTKVITISPCYVFINKTKHTLLIRQEDQSDDVQILMAGQRMPFYYYDARKAELISIKCVDREGAEFDDGTFDWTFKFSVKEIGKMSLFNRSTIDISLSKFILIEKDLQETNQITFVTFSEEDKKFPTYKIENRSRMVQFKYHQKDLPHHEDLLKAGEDRVFAWTNPQADHLISCSFYGAKQNPVGGGREFERKDFQIDDLNLRVQIHLPNNIAPEGASEIYVYTTTNGQSRILTISDISYTETLKLQKEEEKNQSDTIPKQTINIQLSAIGISLIVQTYQQIRKEFAFLYLEGIKFIIVDTDEHREVQLKVNYLQIDNNVSKKQIFPVILYPKDLVKKRDKKKKLEQKGGQEKQDEPVKDFFNSVVKIKKNVPNVFFFEEISFLIQTMVIQMDDELIGYVFRFISNIQDQMHTNFTGVHEVFRVSQIGHGDDWLNYGQSMVNKLNLNWGNQEFQIVGEESGEDEDEDGQNTQKRQAATFAMDEDFRDNQFRTSSMKNVRQAKDPRAMTVNPNQNRTALTNQQTRMTYTSSANNKFSSQHSQSWMNYKIDQKGWQLYIKEYRSSPLDVELSFLSRGKMDVESADKQFSLFDRIKTFGLTLANVDKAPIKVKSFIAFNIFGSAQDITNKFTNHYTDQLKKNIFTILLGSSNILGNPTNFLNHIGTGMTDFIQKPIDGFIQGPLEAGKGIIDGTSSLVKNTVQGAFGSASKVFSSVSKGLLFITDDIDFINKREEDNMDKPKNVLEGLGYGLKSTFTGVASGITGVFENPIQGARKGGMSGFLKGTYKGLAGLVVKPISGTLDFVSKTSEGIKNTASSNERKVNKIRIVRPFYGKIQLIKVYDIFHALVLQHMQKMSRGAFAKDHFIEALHYATAKEDFTLVLTEEHLMIVDTKTRDVTKYWDAQNLNNVKKLGANFIQVNVVDRFEMINQRRNEQAHQYEAFRLQIDDPRQFEKFFKKLRYYIYKLQSEN